MAGPKSITEMDALPTPVRPGDLVEIVRPGTGNLKADPADVLPLSAAHRFRPPWSRKIGSDWKNNSSASGQPGAGALRALPFTWVDGLTITAIEFWRQNATTVGQVLHLGIYDTDPETGMPTDLLWSGSYTVPSSPASGNVVVTVDPGIVGKRAVWLASYLTTGTTQFATGGASGQAHMQLGLPSATATNTSIISLVSNGAWGGAMPPTFPFATDGTAVTTAGAVPQFNLVLAAP